MKLDDIIKVFRKLIAPLQRKVLLTIGRGVILATQDSGKLQLIQGSFLADEVKSDVEKVHHFGFSSHAPKNSDCIMVCVGGSREHGIIIGSESRDHRFKDLAEGEAVIYSKNGDYVHVKNDEIIVHSKKVTVNATDEATVNTKTANVNASTATNITSPTTTIDGNLVVTGDTTAQGEVIAQKSVTATENVVASIAVQAPAIQGTGGSGAVTAANIAATTSLIVGTTELKDYETHTHDYNDVGAPSNPNTTQGVN